MMIFFKTKLFKRVFLWATILSVVVGIVMMLQRNKATNQATAAVAQGLSSGNVPVSVTTVARESIASNLSLVGTITANRDIAITSETQGRVKSVFASIGDAVSIGTSIAQVDDELKQADLLNAEANFDKAKADLTRKEALHKQGVATDAELEGTQLAYKSAESLLITSRRRLRDTRITSPISGKLTSRNVEVGTMVQVGTAVGTVVDIALLKVKVNVAEADVLKLRVGEKVSISTEVYPGVIFDGKIANISDKGDNAHTYPVEVNFANSKTHPLKAGMFAQVIFTSVQPDKTVIVPRDAIIGSIKKAQLYVVSSDSVARLRSIVTGIEANGAVQVLEGLSEGETIVINGQNNLRDGIKVSILK